MSLKKVTGVEVLEYSSTYKAHTARYRFVIGESTNPPGTHPWIPKTRYRRLKKLQSSKVVSVGTIRGGEKSFDKVPVTGKTLWWHKDRFYVEDEDDNHPTGHQRQKGITGLMKIASVTQDVARGSFPRFEKSCRFAIDASQKPSRTAPWISQQEYDVLIRLQRANPTSVGMIEGGEHRDRTLWWYQDEFYVREDHAVGVERKEGLEGLANIASVRVSAIPMPTERRKKEYFYRLKVSSGQYFKSGLFTAKEYREAEKLQSSEPVCLAKFIHEGGKDETLWGYQDEYYTEKEGYTSEQVQLLLWERERKKERKFTRLRKEMLSEHALEDARRERISEDAVSYTHLTLPTILLV